MSRIHRTVAGLLLGVVCATPPVRGAAEPTAPAAEPHGRRGATPTAAARLHEPRRQADLLTLEEAVRLAEEQNHRLQASAAGVRVAEAQVEEARSARLPRAEIQETFQRTTNPVFVFGNLLSQEAFAEPDFAIDSLNEPDALGNFNTRLSASVPLWTGGRISGRVDAAERARAAESASHERTRQEVVEEVVDAWTGAVLAGRHLEVAREALETARSHVELARSLREAGLVVESDLLQARVRESEVEEMVVRAESAVAVSRAALNLLLGRDLETPLRLPEDVDDTELPTTDLDELVSAARAERPDLQAADRRVEAARAMVDAARGEYFPEIGVAGMYEANARDFIGADGTNWTFTVNARLTLFDGGGRAARLRQAEQKVAQAERGHRLLNDGVALQVRQAWHELQAAARRMQLARRAVDLSRESLRIVEDRYREGLAILPELLDAQTAVTRARTREVSARRDLRLGRARLDLAVGSL